MCHDVDIPGRSWERADICDPRAPKPAAVTTTPTGYRPFLKTCACGMTAPSPPPPVLACVPPPPPVPPPLPPRPRCAPGCPPGPCGAPRVPSPDHMRQRQSSGRVCADRGVHLYGGLHAATVIWSPQTCSGAETRVRHSIFHRRLDRWPCRRNRTVPGSPMNCHRLHAGAPRAMSCPRSPPPPRHPPSGPASVAGMSFEQGLSAP